jgi:hypothetical protein
LLGHQIGPRWDMPHGLHPVSRFRTPCARSLGAAGVPRNEIGEVAGTIAQALEQSQVMDRPLSREEVVALLEAAY